MEKEIVEYFNREEADKYGSPDLEIYSKPIVAIYVSIAAAIVLIVTVKVAILGFIILPLALFLLWKAPNNLQLRFYDKFLLLFPYKEDEKCKKINYDDVIEWSMRKGTVGGDILLLHLKDEKYEQIDVFRSIKVVRKLNLVMPDKEANAKNNRKMKNSSFKWPWSKKE